MIHSYTYLVFVSAVVAMLWPQSLAFLLPAATSFGFGTPPKTATCVFHRPLIVAAESSIMEDDEKDDQCSMLATNLSSSSRREWMSRTTTLALMTTVSSLFGRSQVAIASDNYSITKCPIGSKAPCVSTSNVRQLDLYMPPWTFTTSSDEAMARLKGSVIADPLCEIIRQDGNEHLLVSAKRIGGIMDEIEFVINGSDQVVTFRSGSPSNDGTDFGVNKKRLEEIRKRSGIFGIMGELQNSADSVSDGEKGYGPLGQLKSFYGLQSGGGFEDVLKEK